MNPDILDDHIFQRDLLGVRIGEQTNRLASSLGDAVGAERHRRNGFTVRDVGVLNDTLTSVNLVLETHIKEIRLAII